MFNKNILSKGIAILLSFIIIFSTSTALAVKYPTDGLTLDKVNLRSKASLNSTVLDRIPANTIIKLVGKTGGFYKVEYNGRNGYIQDDYAQIGTQPTPTPEPIKYNSLQNGSTGYEVLALQEALSELGYYKGETDAKYGKSTETSVRNFQKKNNLKVDGKASDELQKLIYDKGSKASNGRFLRVKTLAPIADVKIVNGSRGQQIADIQSRLSELGYYSSEITRTYDAKTRQAIAKFQANNGIRLNIGNATPETLSMLYSKLAIPSDQKPTPKPQATPTMPPMPTEKLTKGKKGAQVRNVQKVLSNLGYYTKNITGVYDDNTINAIKDFQEKNSLKKDGVAGANTLSKLFSYSAIAKNSTNINLPVQTPSISISQNIKYPTSIVRELKQGDFGTDVQYMQLKLTELGIYKSRNDGKFLADDRAAVIAYQKKLGIPATGVATISTLQSLYSNTSNSYSLQVLDSNISTTQVKVSLRYGDKGEGVSSLQKRLIELGYLTGQADGIFGKNTKKAVQNFQRKNKLSTDGIAGVATLAVLYSDNSEKGTVQDSGKILLKKGDSSPAVKTLQEHLIRLGYLTGTADGKFGANTQMALIKFQNMHSLKPDGIAGTQTMAALQSKTNIKPSAPTTTAKPDAPSVAYVPSASQVKYENWYSMVRALCKEYPNITLYDYASGISWQLKVFSVGSHADAVPITAQDTANMNRAFAGKTTWTPKPVWVSFSDGTVLMATTHNVPHGTFNKKILNDFPGHLCVHFPRTAAQVQAIGPYATTHQTTIDLGWQQTQQLLGK